MGITLSATGANTTAQTTYTFSGMDFGAEHPKRSLHLITKTRDSATTTTAINSITIGGVAGTSLVNAKATSSNNTIVNLTSAFVPTGTSGDIVITMSQPIIRCGVALYRTTDLDFLSVYDSGVSVVEDPSFSIDIPNSGFAIGGAGGGASTPYTATWSGLSEDIDIGFGTSFFSTASSSDMAYETGATITVTQDGSAGADFASLVASFRPSPNHVAPICNDITGIQLLLTSPYGVYSSTDDLTLASTGDDVRVVADQSPNRNHLILGASKASLQDYKEHSKVLYFPSGSTGGIVADIAGLRPDSQEFHIFGAGWFGMKYGHTAGNLVLKRGGSQFSSDEGYDILFSNDGNAYIRACGPSSERGSFKQYVRQGFSGMLHSHFNGSEVTLYLNGYTGGGSAGGGGPGAGDNTYTAPIDNTEDLEIFPSNNFDQYLIGLAIVKGSMTDAEIEQMESYLGGNAYKNNIGTVEYSEQLWTSAAGAGNHYRIPALASYKNHIVAFCERRSPTNGDFQANDIVCRTSHDNGKTWNSEVVVANNSSTIVCQNPCPVFDNNGKLHLLFRRADGDSYSVTSVAYLTSDDFGATWSSETNILDSFPNSPITWDGQKSAPGNGAYIASSDYIAWPCHVYNSGANRETFALYTTDGGSTFRYGQPIPLDNADEASFAATNDGKYLYCIARSQGGGDGHAVFAKSIDGGISWTKATRPHELLSSAAGQGIAIVGERLLVSTMYCGNDIFANTSRLNIVMQQSNDGGLTWPYKQLVEPWHAGYSVLCPCQNGRVAMLAEVGQDVHVADGEYHIKFSTIKLNDAGPEVSDINELLKLNSASSTNNYRDSLDKLKKSMM